jgi:hypothetical protein
VKAVGELADEPLGLFHLLDFELDALTPEAKRLIEADQKAESSRAALQTDVARAVDSGDWTKVKKSFKAFRSLMRSHSYAEEEMAIRRARELAGSGANLKELCVDNVLALALPSGDFRLFVEFAMQTLEKHQGRKPHTRLFAHALAALSGAEQWLEWKSWIEGALSAEMYAKIEPDLASPYGTVSSPSEPDCKCFQMPRSLRRLLDSSPRLQDATLAICFRPQFAP